MRRSLWRVSLGLALALLFVACDPPRTRSAVSAAAPIEGLLMGGRIPYLQIEIPADGMRVLRNYHQVWGQPRPERIDVKATVRDGQNVYTNVAVHLKGSWTFQPVNGKPSLTLNFDKFAPGQFFHGLDKIHLNNSVQDPTYLCEAVAREVFNEAGVPAPRAGHAQVSLNGRELGFYVLVEGANKRFVKRHFSSAKGNLYDGGSSGDIDSTKLDVDSGEVPEDHSSIEALRAAVRERSPSDRFARLNEVLDVDRFITFVALEVLFQHWDGYSMAQNNYRVFHDASRDKMVFIPHGMDQILGTGRSQDDLIPKWSGVVAKGLFGTGEGLKRYEDRLAQLLDSHFRAESLIAKVDRLAERIQPVATDGWIDHLQFQSRVNNLKSRIIRRTKQAREQMADPEPPLVLGSGETVNLSGWHFQNGVRGRSSSRLIRERDRQVFEVHTDGPASSGSWRKTLILEEGRYEFTGTGRVTNLPVGEEGSGIILRISGERSIDGMSTASSWTPLRYEFELQALARVEFICEYRGSGGFGSFDESTLRLRRLP